MTETGELHEVTRLLGEVAAGETSARDPLIEAVYEELRIIPRARMATERAGHTLQATELVHQAYLRVAPTLPERDFKNHHEFYAAAAEAMRRILIDHARKRGAAKRGGRVALLPIDTVAELADSKDPEAVEAFDEAFEILAAGGSEGYLALLDARTGEVISELSGHVSGVGAVRFSPDGKRLASVAEGQFDAVKLWDVATRREILTLEVSCYRSRQLGMVARWKHPPHGGQRQRGAFVDRALVRGDRGSGVVDFEVSLVFWGALGLRVK